MFSSRLIYSTSRVAGRIAARPSSTIATVGYNQGSSCCRVIPRRQAGPCTAGGPLGERPCRVAPSAGAVPHPSPSYQKRHFSFSFAGPRKLDEILKMELLKGKPTSEISDIWLTYHEEKEHVHGLVLKGSEAKTILSRAAQCPYFVQPVFRDEGYFMLVSQFQTPCHFLMAYLEDFKMDPARAQPLLTFSVFDDLVPEHDVALVRCDIVNRGIEDDEGLKVTQSMLDVLRNDEEFMLVHAFNKSPDSFDVDDYVAVANRKWKKDAAAVGGGGEGAEP